ncbi:MAG: GNAT family N-acetyltransferase [Paraglaciecola sp.]|nr:GNAT family N-acetyltransferase [Paraglaciecola sp.]
MLNVEISAVTIDSKSKLDFLYDNNHIEKSFIDFGLFCSSKWNKVWSTLHLSPRDFISVQLHFSQSKLIAVYPLYLKKISFGYELRFLGSGEPEHTEVCSEFQDFIIAPEFIDESLVLFTKHVKQLKQCYRISFDKILPDSICYKWLKHYQTLGWYYHEHFIGKRFILSIVNNEQAQVTQLEQATLRRQARRFIERTDITVEQCTSEKELPNFFEVLIKLHNLYWQKKGKLGAFSSEQFRQFHRRFASMMLEQQKLLMFKLRYKDDVIAVFYGFYHKGVVYYYQSGISLNSPLLNTGVAMHLTAMRYARACGYQYYDLMTGQDSSYKQQYVKAATPVYTVKLSIFWHTALNLISKLKLLLRVYKEK